MPTIYPPLTIGAARRLELFKREAAQGKWARPMTWRDVRFATLKSHTGLGGGTNDDTPIWATQDGEQFRNERDAHRIAKLDYTGWRTDPDGDESAIGIVAGLPHGRFLAGYRLTMNDERVYFPTIHTDEREAARVADEHARVIGEQECEYSERWRAAQDLRDEIEGALDSIGMLRRQHRRAVGDDDAPGYRDAAHYRAKVARLVARVREAREELTRYRDVE